MYRINIIGSPKGDTVLFLARIFQAMNKKVLIRDVTEKGELQASVPSVEGIDPRRMVLDYAGVGYLIGHYSFENSEEEAQFGEEYDIMMSLFDSRTMPGKAEMLVVITDECRERIESLEQTLRRTVRVLGGQERLGNERFIVIRDYTGAVPGQFSGLYEILIPTGRAVLNLSKKDRKCAVESQYVDDYRFMGISSEYESFLQSVSETVTGGTEKQADRKELLRAYKTAASGEVFRY